MPAPRREEFGKDQVILRNEVFEIVGFEVMDITIRRGETGKGQAAYRQRSERPHAVVYRSLRTEMIRVVFPGSGRQGRLVVVGERRALYTEHTHGRFV